MLRSINSNIGGFGTANLALSHSGGRTRVKAIFSRAFDGVGLFIDDI